MINRDRKKKNLVPFWASGFSNEKVINDKLLMKEIDGLRY